MWRRPLVLVLPVLATTAVGAHIASGDAEAPRAAPSDPAVAASSTLRLPAMQRCVRRSFVRVGLVPPAGDAFASLSVSVDGAQVLQLASLSGPGTVLVRLPQGQSRVRANGTTSSGRFHAAAQTYRRCSSRPEPRAKPQPRPKPRAKPQNRPKPRPTPRPVILGGGED